MDSPLLLSTTDGSVQVIILGGVGDPPTFQVSVPPAEPIQMQERQFMDLVAPIIKEQFANAA